MAGTAHAGSTPAKRNTSFQLPLSEHATASMCMALGTEQACEAASMLPLDLRQLFLAAAMQALSK